MYLVLVAKSYSQSIILKSKNNNNIVAKCTIKLLLKICIQGDPKYISKQTLGRYSRLKTSVGSNYAAKTAKKIKSNNLVVLEIFSFEESRNLIGQENFGAKMQELGFPQAYGFHTKQENH